MHSTLNTSSPQPDPLSTGPTSDQHLPKALHSDIRSMTAASKLGARPILRMTDPTNRKRKAGTTEANHEDSSHISPAEDAKVVQASKRREIIAKGCKCSPPHLSQSGCERADKLAVHKHITER